MSGSNQDANSQNTAEAVRPAGAQSANAVPRSSRSDHSQGDGQRNQQSAPKQPIKRVVPDPADALRASRSESKPVVDKVEVKDFDLGRSASEIVGTVDAVQRFDNNSDGRVDLLESHRATRARDTSFTYAARGQARAETSNVAEQVQQQEIQQSLAPRAETASQPSVAPSQTTVAEETAKAPLKKFGDPQVVSGGSSEEGTVTKKYVAAEEIASQGGFSDGAPVQQKFFGDGAEVVIGRFAADTDGPQKFADKAVAESGRYYEEGSGEQKFYDKVAQSEPGSFAPDQDGKKYYDSAEDAPATANGSGSGQPEASLYEKAQQVESQAGGHGGTGQEPKKLYGELELYSDVAGLGEEPVIAGESVVATVTV
ncbi:MAG: hypothetical protein HOH20_14305 [Rhodospirillaceae bacterium]|nr:hypothetical protein [Rhodospirillaceae bacterium]MBT5240440.1 hypothetical protein [Rhodospirillaceae bacterium]MBT5566692.1 hypothetical protein [Rhodospirillaceae bacterium]MBT6090743.1 hypothetical protein [Rhodospirillaceae bacterium]MBT6962051.1 hypothetical protein [Rhodospirillaceae bacterium]